MSKMWIRNAGRGIHQREIPGIEKLSTLPSNWYAFTNLELSLGPGQSRENDVFLVIEDRILLVDLKDWGGTIETDGRWWNHNGRRVEPSPVDKVRSNARKLYEVLRGYLAEMYNTAPSKVAVPYCQGCVMLTATRDKTAISQNERTSVFLIDEFLQNVIDPGTRNAMLGLPIFVDRTNALTAPNGYWRKTLGTFFNIDTGPFRPRQRLYGNYRACSDDASYDHRVDPTNAIYHEYDAEEDAPGRSPGLLRIWNFSHAAPRFQSPEGRAEIAGRERDVLAYLKDRNPYFDVFLLQPRDADYERSVTYWEVFEKRRQLQRLRDVTLRSISSDQIRVDWARNLIAGVKALHDLDCSHLDIGAHSVWLEEPSTVKVSHLFAASYPTIQSLGEHRYQFLTAGWRFPEDCLGVESDHKKRDVFLLGSAVHQLLFNARPIVSREGDPPEWRVEVDLQGQFQRLHLWFQRALAWDPTERFTDAAQALEHFNRALHTDLSGANTLKKIERFRKWQDQLELVESFPRTEALKSSTCVAVWRSDVGSSSVVVKLWKRACWDDDRKEAPRILGFLERAEELGKRSLYGTAPIVEAAFLGDSIALIQDYVSGDVLQKCLDEGAAWFLAEPALAFIERLIIIVASLHDGGVSHGDLKPANIVVKNSDDSKVEPVLIDMLEFTSDSEGDRRTTAYAPQTGGRFERDRYAVTKIAEDIMTRCRDERVNFDGVRTAISVCQSGPTPNATLLPLLEAIRTALEPPAPEIPVLAIALQQVQAHSMLSDEGEYYVRRNRRGNIVVRGAVEELELQTRDGKFTTASLRKLQQGAIARLKRFELCSFSADIRLASSAVMDLRALDFIHDQLHAFPEQDVAARGLLEDESIAPAVDDERAEDELAETAQAVPEPVSPIDVPNLWRTLIDVEQELYTEGIAASDSVYRRDRKRHMVSFDLERGAFDFNRSDRVLIERPRKSSDAWVEVGILDIEASTPYTLVFEASSRFAGSPIGPVIRAEERLRFRSLMETFSRSRRDAATKRILDRQSVCPGIVDVFDVSIATRPTDVSLPPGIDDTLSRYELNDDQCEAFKLILARRPIGLLQGPPGTGKTRFIASLVHFVLSHGYAKNVLLSSQSHEAVNNAAEETMKLFRKEGEEPSLVRVGQEGSISAELRPFHAERIERQYKDRFRSGLISRLRRVGLQIGVQMELLDRVIFAETTIRPVWERLQDLAGEEKAAARVPGLTETLRHLCSKIGLTLRRDVAFDSGSFDAIIDAIVGEYDVNRDHVARVRAVCKLSRDWLASVSTRQRSFETFLAGTRNVVAGTCVGLGRSSLGLVDTTFDLVVIDEAARCTASELAVPMQVGRWMVLVGDQLQLEPHHRPDVVRQASALTGMSLRQITSSDFGRVFASAYGSDGGFTLTTQYRMLKPIGEMVSSAFYSRVLTHGRTEPVIPPDVLPEWLSRPVLWLSTDTLGERGRQQPANSGRSLQNDSEADAIVALLKDLDAHEPFNKWLSSQDQFDRPIGVICTYAAQRELVKRRIAAAALTATLRDSVKVDTVDSYQGKQNPLVILSLVRNNADGLRYNGHPSIRDGFMSRPNRINVAISRAMDRLIVVGAMNGWAPGSPMSSVVRAFGDQVGSQTASSRPVAPLTKEVASPSPRARFRAKGQRK